MDRGAWWATVHGASKSQAQLCNWATAVYLLSSPAQNPFPPPWWWNLEFSLGNSFHPCFWSLNFRWALLWIPEVEAVSLPLERTESLWWRCFIQLWAQDTVSFHPTLTLVISSWWAMLFNSGVTGRKSSFLAGFEPWTLWQFSAIAVISVPRGAWELSQDGGQSQDRTRNWVWGHWRLSQGLYRARRDFPGGLVAATPCFQCRGPRLDTWLGNYIPHATTKTQHSQRKKEMFHHYLKKKKKVCIKRKNLQFSEMSVIFLVSFLFLLEQFELDLSWFGKAKHPDTYGQRLVSCRLPFA